MKPPILIFEGLDVSIHASLDHAISSHEVVDVKAGILEAYDSDGFLLNLMIVPNRGREEIVIEERQPAEYRPAELRKRLVDYLKMGKLTISESDDVTTLELMRRAAKLMPWKLSI